MTDSLGQDEHLPRTLGDLKEKRTEELRSDAVYANYSVDIMTGILRGRMHLASTDGNLDVHH